MTTITMTDLQATHTELAHALQSQASAQAAAQVASESYNTTIQAKLDEYRAKLIAEHQAVADQYEQAKAAEDAAAEKVKQLREQAKAKLTAYTEQGVNEYENKKPLAGFARRDTAKPLIEDELALRNALARSAPFLLKIDHKALEAFVRAYATVQTDADGNGRTGHILPPNFTFGGWLKAKTEYTWTVSDKSIMALGTQPTTDAQPRQIP
jgi:hypothetical protein